MSDLIPGFEFKTDRLIWSKPRSGRYTVTLDDGTYLVVFQDGHWERLDIDANGYVVLNRGNDGLDPEEFNSYSLLQSGKASAEAFYEDLKDGHVMTSIPLPETEAV